MGQETREERTFCVWMSTFLEAGDAAITNLSESLKDGYLLLRVLDQLAPGCVSWKKAHKPPFKPLLRRPASIENCNQVRLCSATELPESCQ
jgi:plastin-1